MSDDAPASPVRRRSRSRLVFSLFLVALVCGAISWFARPKTVSATALFEVRRNMPSLVGNQPGLSSDESDYEILRKTQIALLKSKFLLTSALRNPIVAKSMVFAGVADREDWLQNHLEVSYPQDGEILEIKLLGASSQINDLILIVDAVAAAYKSEVLGAEKARQLNQRDILERSLENLSAEIKRKYEDYLDISIGMGRPDGSNDVQQQLDMKRMDRIEEEVTQLERDTLKMQAGGDAKDAKFVAARLAMLVKQRESLQKEMIKRSLRSVDLTTRKSELEQLQGIANELAVTLEKIDIDSQSPSRIRQVQMAIPGTIASQ